MHHVLQYGGTKQTSEQFNTAGRTVKTGLIANVIVSEWTWAATLLQRWALCRAVAVPCAGAQACRSRVQGLV